MAPGSLMIPDHLVAGAVVGPAGPVTAHCRHEVVPAEGRETISGCKTDSSPLVGTLNT